MPRSAGQRGRHHGDVHAALAARGPSWPLALLVAAHAVAAAARLLAWLCAAALIGAVQAAVYHAEVVAHRVGEPFGTLVLAWPSR